MMTLFIFYAIFLGIYGILFTQYLAIYNEINVLFHKKNFYRNCNRNENFKLCYEIEFLHGRFLTSKDSFYIVIIPIFIIYFTILFVLSLIYPIIGQENRIIYMYSFCLSTIFLVIVSMYPFIKPFEAPIRIENKLFEMWYNNNCFLLGKNDQNKLESNPHRFYFLLAEKIENGNIENPPHDLINLVKPLFKRPINFHP